MGFSQFVTSGKHAVAEGAVLERVRRDPSLTLDPHILNGGYVYNAALRVRLTEIHSNYIELARKYGLPILTFTDTWRCSQKAIDASPFKGLPVNEDNAHFLIKLRATFGEGPDIFIGGLIGPAGDAYSPAEGLDRRAARNFHRPQIEALASAGVDFLHLATVPNVEEALGVADVMAETNLPFIISFVIRRTGIVLDGTPLGEAMLQIDHEAPRPPVGFSVNCVHANALGAALEKVAACDAEICERLLAFQANTADCEVEDLDGSVELITEPPLAFAENLRRLRARFKLRILGGCCGTEGEHIEALAKTLVCEEIKNSP